MLRRFEAFLEGKRCKPGGSTLKQVTCEAGSRPSHAEPEAVASHWADGLSEQQWLADDRKRKSHLISPSPLASPAERHSLAEEASETLVSPELAAMLSAEFSSGAQSPMRGAAHSAGATSAGKKSIGVPVSGETVALPCSACEGTHARGRCLEQASGCCTPEGSEESAHSAVATRLIDQEWPEHTVGPSDQAHEAADRLSQQPDHSQGLAVMVESALQRAVQQLVLAGQLPSMQCPALLVKAPRQQKVPRGNMVLTSPAAHALAAAARRQQGGLHHPPYIAHLVQFEGSNPACGRVRCLQWPITKVEHQTAVVGPWRRWLFCGSSGCGQGSCSADVSRRGCAAGCRWVQAGSEGRGRAPQLFQAGQLRHRRA